VLVEWFAREPNPRLQEGLANREMADTCSCTLRKEAHRNKRALTAATLASKGVQRLEKVSHTRCNYV
jgi:hypothetical protein